MDKLGIDPLQLLAQIINFSILLFVLRKFLYQPILKNIRARQKKIKDSLESAEKTKVMEEKMAERKQEMIKEAREEGRVIINNAKKDAKKVREEIVAEAKKDALKHKEKVEKELKAKYSQLEKALSQKTSDIALEIVGKILPDMLKEVDQRKLIAKQLAKMERMLSKK